MTAIKRAISIVGGPSALARELGVTPQAVCFWRDEKRKLPAEVCPTIERLTNHEVICEQLLPKVEWAVVRRQIKKSV